MLTFLELYQTLLGFVFFKLYTDAGLVYPPPLDTKKDEGAAGVGAFSLQEAKESRDTTTTARREARAEHTREIGRHGAHARARAQPMSFSSPFALSSPDARARAAPAHDLRRTIYQCAQVRKVAHKRQES